LRGGVLKRVLLVTLTNGEDDGLEDIKVQLERHNMALNGSACNNEIS
jgi:hypothetical protein